MALMNVNKKELSYKIANIFVELILLVFGFLGLYINLFSNDFMGGSSFMFLYFTIQSNITIILIVLVFFILKIIELFTNKQLINNILLHIKFLFTVAITVTFLVFFLMLAPSQDVSYLASMSNLTVHAIVPILALIDYFIFDKNITFNKISPLVGTFMPLYYLAFVFICVGNNITFGGNLKVPYFFLDFESLTWFNFTSKGPGVFYWILILLFSIIGLSYLLAFISNSIHHKSFKRNKNNNN